MNKSTQRRIGIAITNLKPGGAERLLLRTIPLYVQKGFEVTLYLLNLNNSNLDYLHKLEESCEVRVLNCPRPYSPSVLFKLRQILKNERIIHVHLFPLNFWMILARYFVRSKVFLLNTEHGIINSTKAKSKFVKRLLKWIYQRMDVNVLISPEMLKKIRGIGVSSRCETILNGIDLSEIKSIKGFSRNELFDVHSIPKNVKLILMVSRLHPGKRHDLLLEALATLTQQYHLGFLGFDAATTEIQTRIADHGLQERVHILGFQSNAVAYMKSADLNVLFSDSEGMSGVVVEALLSERPFLGSNVSGIKDIVPGSDFLVENNAYRIAERIVQILENDSQMIQMAKEGLEKSEEFDLNLMVNRHIEIYNELLEL